MRHPTALSGRRNFARRVRRQAARKAGRGRRHELSNGRTSFKPSSHSIEEIRIAAAGLETTAVRSRFSATMTAGWAALARPGVALAVAVAAVRSARALRSYRAYDRRGACRQTQAARTIRDESRRADNGNIARLKNSGKD